MRMQDQKISAILYFIPGIIADDKILESINYLNSKMPDILNVFRNGPQIMVKTTASVLIQSIFLAREEGIGNLI